MDRELPELPMLAAITGFLRWCEELLTILSGPLLTAGLMIALTDLLTNGALLATQPALVYAWAIAMGAGLDAQLIGTSVKVGRAARTGHPWHAALYSVLVLALAYVAFIAAQVFATQQAEGITTSAALSRLGMDGTTWLIQRSALSVALVVLSGLLRYHAPQAASVADERAKLERELELEPLRQRVRAGRALGYVALARNAALAARGEVPDERPPTGPGTPSKAPTPSKGPAPDPVRAGDDTPLHLVPRHLRRRSRTRNAERRVRDYLARHPGATAYEIARRLRISDSTASKYRRLLESESQRTAERIAR